MSILRHVCLPLCFVSSLGQSATLESFERLSIDDSPDKPAFINTADLDGDGKQEIIVSMFGNSPVGSGSVYIYRQAGDERGTWQKMKLQGSDTRFPNAVTLADINQDGRTDIILPGGFLACTFPFGNCGSLQWFEQKADGSFAVRTLKSRNKRFYHHVEYVDFNYDGIKDLVAVGEEKGLSGDGSSELHVYYGNDSALGFETSPDTIFKGLGSFPSVRDLDQDGQWEVYSSEYFGSKGSFSWIKKNEQGAWQRYYIDQSVGKTIQLSFVDNLFNDGRLWVIGANHTNTMDDGKAPESAVYAYQVPDFSNPSFEPSEAWPKKKLSSGIVSVKSPLIGPQGAPGVFATGDVDGDGDLDVIVHGDGDPRVFWLRQNADQSFTTLPLDTEMPQGGVAVADLDGDGKAEIIASSYESNKLYLYRLK